MLTPALIQERSGCWPWKKLRDGVHQHGVGGSGLETTGFFERQDALHPAVALGTRRPQGPLPPQDATPQGSLGPVVGRLDAVVGEKDPERVHLPQQAAGKPSRVIVTVMILVNQLAQPGIPRPPLPTRGWGCGHMAQAVATPPTPTRHTPPGRRCWRSAKLRAVRMRCAKHVCRACTQFWYTP